MSLQSHWRSKRFACFCLAVALVGTGVSAANAASRKLTVIASVDLSDAFGTRSAWRFTAMQGPPVEDPFDGGGTVPGDILVCISKANAGRCDASLQGTLRPRSPNDYFSTPHYLGAAQILHPRDASGRLKGDIISVEPTENAPYGFWVTVNALSPDYTYRQILRYRSATRYGDGNPLAVIDSEMPNIEQHLGLWRPGSPLPLPTGTCTKPHLVRAEFWCKRS